VEEKENEKNSWKWEWRKENEKILWRIISFIFSLSFLHP
jgi:hypothetical protein